MSTDEKAPRASGAGMGVTRVAIQRPLFMLMAILAVLMSAVSMFYYLRLVVAMYLREGREADVAITRPLQIVAATCLIITLLLGIYPTPLINQATESSRWIGARAAIIPHAGR